MLIAFAFSLIGVLLVYGNYKFLRNNKIRYIALVLTTLLAIIGIYLLRNSDVEKPFYLMASLSPLIGLVNFLLVRSWFLRRHKMEMILYLGGLIPGRAEERFVSRFEKLVTILITATSLFLAYLVVWGIERWA